MVKSKGLGDSIEKITKATGIKKVVDKISEVTGIDCGCEKRQKYLNQLYPYARTFTQDEKVIYESVMPRVEQGVISGADQSILVKLYNKVFKANKSTSRCGSCVQQTLKKLASVYEASCENKKDE
jgi:hypothetical protein